jgi:hypothetical protein
MEDLVPIIVGITGHRDILEENKDILRQEICNIFKELKSNYVNTPIILLSPLAEGADRIAAEAAICSGIPYMVPLPLEKEEYEKDFVKEESKVEFNRLLSTAAESFIALESSKDIPREKHYEAAGVYIVKHCHILIALWDGKEANGIGGTAQIVGFRLNGIPEEYLSHKSQVQYIDDGAVYHIPTPRTRNKDIKTDFKPRKMYAEFWNDTGNAEAEYNRIFEQMDEFNEDIIKYSDILKPNIGKSRQYILGSNPVSSEDAEGILKRFVLADSLSLHFQAKKQSILKFNLVFTGIIISSFLLYDEFWQTPVLLLTYLGALTAAYFGAYRNRRKKYENKYLDYRALAEGLRIQFFWETAGIYEDVSEYYLTMQKSEMQWIRNSIRSLNMVKENRAGSYKEHKFVLENWLKDQFNYYTKASNKNSIRGGKLDKFITGLFVFNVLIICLLFYSEAFNTKFLEINLMTTVWNNRIMNVATLGLAKILTGLSGAIIAVTGNYSDRMALGEQCKRYYKMQQLFGRSIELAKKALEKNDLELSREIIKELGVEALEENGDWILLFRERPVEAPRG